MPRGLFLFFFWISTQGLRYAPSKIVKFLTFFNNSRKIEGATNEGTPHTQRISVVDPTLRWSRFSPPPPPEIFLEPKQFFPLGACLGAYSPKSNPYDPSFSPGDRVIRPLKHMKKSQKSFCRKLLVFKVENWKKNSKLHYNRWKNDQVPSPLQWRNGKFLGG